MSRNRKQGTRPRFVIPSLVAMTLLATACSSGVPAKVAVQTPVGPQYIGICIDPHTGQRVPDEDCGTSFGADGMALGAGNYTEEYIDSWRYPDFIIPGVGFRPSRTVIMVRTVPRSVTINRISTSTTGSVATIRTNLAKTASGAGSRPAAGKPAAGTAPKGNSGSSPGIQRGGFGVPNAGTSGKTGTGTSGGTNAGTNAGTSGGS